MCHGKVDTKNAQITESDMMASEPIEGTYTNIVGPMTCISMVKAKYLVTFFDDFSGYSILTFVVRKSKSVKSWNE